MPLVSIVEGHGEVAALPVLLRRLAQWLTPNVVIHVPAPIRVRKDRFLNNEDEFRRVLQLAANKCGDEGWILVLLDADDDCPMELAASIRKRAAGVIPHARLSSVIANREYEAWFIAAAASLAEHRRLSLKDIAVPHPETPRNAKGWVEENLMGGIYGETTDQPKLSAAMDLDQVLASSRSFRKLCRDFTSFTGTDEHQE